MEPYRKKDPRKKISADARQGIKKTSVSYLWPFLDVKSFFAFFLKPATSWKAKKCSCEVSSINKTENYSVSMPEQSLQEFWATKSKLEPA